MWRRFDASLTLPRQTNCSFQALALPLARIRSLQDTGMDILLLLVLLAVIGGGGYYVSQRTTVTRAQQDAIVRGELDPDTLQRKNTG